MKNLKPFQGPSITWKHDDVKRAVKKYGFEEAAKMFAGETLKLAYVRKTINLIISFKK